MTTDQIAYNLQELLADDSVIFRVHNIKLSTLTTQLDLPQMLLSHYDNLDETIKQNNPLTPKLLKQANLYLTASEANQHLNLPLGSVKPAHHIKIQGTCVVACDELLLALHLHFTNTAKPNQTAYGNDISQLVRHEASCWKACGKVNILYKHKNKLTSMDLHGDELHIHTSENYFSLPNTHALATTYIINQLRDEKPARFEFLQNAIVDKVMAEFENLS